MTANQGKTCFFSYFTSYLTFYIVFRFLPLFLAGRVLLYLMIKYNWGKPRGLVPGMKN